MSSLGGVYNFDGKRVSERILVAMGEVLASRGPDGGSEIRSDSIGMVWRAFHTDKESRCETQPLVSADGQMLCWDGRLDNRDDLISILHAELRGNKTDAAIVLGAYKKWGERFLPKVIGDFALSLWDPGTRTLLLARDLAGPRPLFYFADDARVIWSSELSLILDLAGIELGINEEYVACYLTGDPERDLTPYKGIYAVPPGSAVVVHNEHVSIRRFWKPDPEHEIRYKTDAEYEEHFRHLFREAVLCRLRADGPVWATLSGGLDSSAVVCMADAIIASGEAEAPRLETVSYVYDESSDSDEREYINSVEAKRTRSGHHILESMYPVFQVFPNETEVSFPDGMDCLLGRHRALCADMREDGARVLLAGFGGDEMLCSNPNPMFELQDCIAQGQFLRLHRAVRAWSKTLKRPYTKLLLRSGILPSLPIRVQAALIDPNMSIPSYYEEEFASRLKLRERYVRLHNPFSMKTPSKRLLVASFLSAVQVVSRAPYRSRGLIEVANPYLHRPLVEFLLAVPLTQKLRPGETRSLMRRALRDLLPEKILNRKGKKGPEEAFLRAVAREWSRLRPMFENAQVSFRGYLDNKALLETLDRARHGCPGITLGLARTITLEFWLRSLKNRSMLYESAAAADLKAAPLSAAQIIAQHDTRNAAASGSPF